MDERRRYCRVQVQHAIVARPSADVEVSGILDNLCLRGALVKTDKAELLTEGAIVTFEIMINDKAQGECRILGKAKVLRRDSKKEYALHFKEVEAEGFAHLRRLLELNYGFGDKIEAEIITMLGEE